MIDIEIICLSFLPWNLWKIHQKTHQPVFTFNYRRLRLLLKKYIWKYLGSPTCCWHVYTLYFFFTVKCMGQRGHGLGPCTSLVIWQTDVVQVPQWQLLKCIPLGKMKHLNIYINCTAALFNSSVNHTDATDWLSSCCADEINRWTNKTTPFTACDVTI